MNKIRRVLWRAAPLWAKVNFWVQCNTAAIVTLRTIYGIWPNRFTLLMFALGTVTSVLLLYRRVGVRLMRVLLKKVDRPIGPVKNNAYKC